MMFPVREPNPHTILHIPYTYFPDAAGGTEVYVSRLTKGLVASGYKSVVGAPGLRPTAYRYQGIEVFRFATNPNPRIEHAYGLPDETAAASFAGIVQKTRPSVVHIHACTSAVSELLVDIAHNAGARVIFTYHTPTVSCARGTMLLFGDRPCDGQLYRKRCAQCVLNAHGVPKAIARMIAATPLSLSARKMSLAGGDRIFSPFRIPWLLSESHARFQRFMREVDHIVAVCDWVKSLLLENGVPAYKITLCRQGIEYDGGSLQAATANREGALRVAFFGRLDRTKGADLLLAAMARMPKADIRLDLYLVRQFGTGGEWETVVVQAHQDRRISIKQPVPPDEVCHTMANYDLIAVPSRWLETGPLVVLEAFAAGVPVLGANHGGIAELIRDGVDGILVPPGDVGQLARALAKVAVDRMLLASLRRNIKKPRTMHAVVEDMARLYNQVVATPSAQRADIPCSE
jgi:glycosyltransferase involved in cell wall biosynthesis